MKKIQLLKIFILIFFPAFTNAQKAKNIYYPKLPQVEISVAKEELAFILKTTKVWKSGPNYIPPPPICDIINVSVLDNIIQIDYKNSSETILFSDIFKYNISANYCEGKPDFPCMVILGNHYFRGKDANYTIELTDYLYYFQFHRYSNVQNHYDSLISLFKSIAEQYQQLKIKPSMLEEQRKYIVQANLLNQEKKYAKAIQFYQNAIEVDETSYPAVYSNLALISAQIKDFQGAIFYMRKYLMLVPEAEDARSCQDKIYEWELKIE